MSKTGRVSWELKPRLWLPPGKGLWGQPPSYHPPETLLNQSIHRAVNRGGQSNTLLRLEQCFVDAERFLPGQGIFPLHCSVSCSRDSFPWAMVCRKKVPSPLPSSCWLNENDLSEAKEKRSSEGELISGFCHVPRSPKGPYLHLFIRNIIIDSGLRPLILAGSCISRKYKG